MSFSLVEVQAPDVSNVAVSDEALSVELSDGRALTVPIDWYPRLAHATEEERASWILIDDGQGIRWPHIDEDISARGLLLGRASQESQASLKRWLDGNSPLEARGATEMDEFDAGTFAQEYQSPDGQNLWSVLTRANVVARMETASDLGKPALAAVEEILLKEIGTVMLRKRFKQMAGRMVKQVLDRRGFERDAPPVRLNSVPFNRASRFRRRNRPSLYLFRSTSNFRKICLTDTRDGAKLPAPAEGRWNFVNTIDSPIKAQIGYGFDLRQAISTVSQKGYVVHTVPKIVGS